MNEEIIEKLEEVAALLRNEVIECVQESMEENIHNAIEDYVVNHEDIWYRIKNRISRETKEGIVANSKHDLWCAFEDLRQQITRDIMQLKTGTPHAELTRLNSNIDKLHQNMDALFMEVQSLKRWAPGPYNGE